MAQGQDRQEREPTMSTVDPVIPAKCPKCGHKTVWGVEVRGEYDGVLFWECPACKHAWPRFPEGTRWHQVAASFIVSRF